MGKTSPKQREKRARPSSSGSDEHQHGEHSESDLIVELFARIKALEDKGQAQTTRMNDLQGQLDAARVEISTLTKKVKELEESLEFTQKEQDDVDASRRNLRKRAIPTRRTATSNHLQQAVEINFSRYRRVRRRTLREFNKTRSALWSK